MRRVSIENGATLGMTTRVQGEAEQGTQTLITTPSEVLTNFKDLVEF